MDQRKRNDTSRGNERGGSRCEPGFRAGNSKGDADVEGRATVMQYGGGYYDVTMVLTINETLLPRNHW